MSNIFQEIPQLGGVNETTGQILSTTSPTSDSLNDERFHNELFDALVNPSFENQRMLFIITIFVGIIGCIIFSVILLVPHRTRRDIIDDENPGQEDIFDTTIFEPTVELRFKNPDGTPGDLIGPPRTVLTDKNTFTYEFEEAAQRLTRELTGCVLISIAVQLTLLAIFIYFGFKSTVGGNDSILHKKYLIFGNISKNHVFKDDRWGTIISIATFILIISIIFVLVVGSGGLNGLNASIQSQIDEEQRLVSCRSRAYAHNFVPCMRDKYEELMEVCETDTGKSKEDCHDEVYNELETTPEFTECGKKAETFLKSEFDSTTGDRIISRNYDVCEGFERYKKYERNVHIAEEEAKCREPIRYDSLRFVDYDATAGQNNRDFSRLIFDDIIGVPISLDPSSEKHLNIIGQLEEIYGKGETLQFSCCVEKSKRLVSQDLNRTACDICPEFITKNISSCGDPQENAAFLNRDIPA